MNTKNVRIIEKNTFSSQGSYHSCGSLLRTLVYQIDCRVAAIMNTNDRMSRLCLVTWFRNIHETHIYIEEERCTPVSRNKATIIIMDSLVGLLIIHLIL